MLTTFRKDLIHLVLTVRSGSRIPPGEIRSQLAAVVAEGIRTCNGCAVAVASLDDHLHALLTLHGECGPDDVAACMKRVAADWLRPRMARGAAFEWNDGYALFAVDRAFKLDVRDFILDQARFHRGIDFREELVRMRESPWRANLPANWS
ncbi:MAG: transposase [Acidobacteria bacterium]|nr:transposase [Acidobacteriota bacterium]